MTSIQSYVNGRYVPETFVQTLPDALTYGVELEVEWSSSALNHSRFARSMGDLMRAETDGSLRGNNSELIFSRPLPYNVAVDTLRHCMKVIKDQKKVINPHSTRTSTHVHINFNNRTVYDLCRFYLCYLKCEEWLFSFAGQNRDGNSFCLPTYYSEDIFLRFMRFLYNPSGVGLSNVIRTDRYAGLNFHPLGTFGSLEIRSGRGISSTDDEFLFIWLDAIDRILKTSMSVDIGTLYKMKPSNILGTRLPNTEAFDNGGRNDERIQGLFYSQESWDEFIKKTSRKVEPSKYKSKYSGGWSETGLQTSVSRLRRSLDEVPVPPRSGQENVTTNYMREYEQLLERTRRDG